MPACSRCGSLWPNPACFVCGEHPRNCQCHDCIADRNAEHGDYLRDEMIDRQMEREREGDNHEYEQDP